MSARIVYDSAGVMIESGSVQDDSLTALVFISMFTDARAEDSDVLPDNSNDRRGWPGDTFYDEPWGSRLWLLYREKLTTDVRNRAVKYTEDCLSWMLVESGDGVTAKSITVTGSIPQYQVLALTVVITKPDDSVITLTVSKQWDIQYAL
ncbi:phage GP46 family protein [Aliivibrio fischeri]